MDTAHSPTPAFATYRLVRDAMISDARITRYLAARDELNRAPTPAASEQERAALPGYIEAHAEIVDRLAADGACPVDRRRTLMREMVQDLGLPVGAVLSGFAASPDEAEYARNGQPLRIEPEDEIARLRALPYATYLQTDHWKLTRAAALERAENRCQGRGRDCTGQLQVHHRDDDAYDRRGQERPADLTVYCVDCHQRIHGIEES